MTRHLIATCAASSLLLVLASTAQDKPAETRDAVPDATIIVLDGSGSMWGQIDGTTKIEIAREVLTDILHDWSPDTEIGLFAYGHRREADCSDIEELQALSSPDDAAIADLVKTVTPTGKTPLTEAVRVAAGELVSRSGNRSIILLTDGLETCSGDPCALGRELAEADLGLTTHVIGFDLADADTTALQCLAAETGGQYFDAADADGLRDALSSASETVIVERNVMLRAIDADGEPIEEGGQIEWQIFSLGDDGTVGDRVALTRGAAVEFSLEPGRYAVLAQQGDDFTLRANLLVEDGEPLVEDIVFATGQVVLTPFLLDGGEPFTDLILSWKALDETGTEVAREAGKRARLILPPGAYRGVVSAEDLDVEFDFVVTGGETSEVSVNLNAGYVFVGSGLSMEWLIQREVDGKMKTVASEVRKSYRFVLPAGDYIVKARAGDIEWVTEISLQPGGTEYAEYDRSE